MLVILVFTRINYSTVRNKYALMSFLPDSGIQVRIASLQSLSQLQVDKVLKSWFGYFDTLLVWVGYLCLCY